MAIKLLPPRTAFISGAISAAATVLPIDQTFSDIIASAIDFGGGDYFYLTLYEDDVREEIKVTNKAANNLTIVRAQGDTGVTPDVTGYAFSLAAKYTADMNKAAVEDIAALIVPTPTFDLAGLGLVEVVDLGGGNWSIDVPAPTYTGVSGVEITGTWGEYEVGLTNDGNCCAPEDEEEAGTVNLIGVGLVTVEDTELGWEINVPAPSFTGVGVDITGTWPNYTFTVTAAGSGTVTEIAVGSGLVLTGDPNVNPTIDIATTGVVAGDYGGIVINDTGQITAVPTTLDPVSIVVAGDGIDIARVGDEVTISGIDAAIGTVGVVALADDAAALDPLDDTTAVTPALLAAVIADLEGVVPQGGQTYSGEADGDYTVTLPTVAITLDLAAGEKALVLVNTTARGAVLTDPVNYAIAVFNATGTRIQSNKKINQNEQSMVFFIDGPSTDGLVLKHTALAGGETVPSYSMVALKL